MSSQNAIQAGSNVQLRSGGPTMTVNTVTIYGECECGWFNGTMYQYASFSKAALKLADDADEDEK
jgi:uncharacterized protein YodC (DUF2158 family)